MPVINVGGEDNKIIFDNAYTSLSGTTYTLTLTIPPFSKYKFTESSEQSTLGLPIEKTYTAEGAGISGYIKPDANINESGKVT